MAMQTQPVIRPDYRRCRCILAAFPSRAIQKIQLREISTLCSVYRSIRSILAFCDATDLRIGFDCKLDNLLERFGTYPSTGGQSYGPSQYFDFKRYFQFITPRSDA